MDFYCLSFSLFTLEIDTPSLDTSERDFLAGQIPARKVHEDDRALAFHDVNPQVRHS